LRQQHEDVKVAARRAEKAATEVKWNCFSWKLDLHCARYQKENCFSSSTKRDLHESTETRTKGKRFVLLVGWGERKIN